MITTTTRIALAADLIDRLTAVITDSSFQPRLWSKGEQVRIYTGSRSEYIAVTEAGEIETSQTHISWGHVIAEVLYA